MSDPDGAPHLRPWPKLSTRHGEHLIRYLESAMQPSPSRRQFLGTVAAALGAAATARSQVGPAASQPGSVHETLTALLARNRERHPEYRGGLSNHMSMALIALADLGAPAKRLEGFDQSHSRKLEPFPARGESVAREEWRGAIGNPDALWGLVRMFEADIQERGRDAVLREALPPLVSGLGGAAFHCMIRTAYAVRAGDDAEVAHGLAYWATRATQLGAVQVESGTERDPRVLLERARADAALANQSFPGGLIVDDMRRAAALPGFPGVVSALELKSDTLDRLALAMLDLYASTGDFTALHAVTSTHAFRVLGTFMADRELALRYHWQALAAVYVGIGTPKIDATKPGSPPAWDEILPRAVASEDEHTIKLVDSCREEERARGSGSYRAVAARRVGLA